LGISTKVNKELRQAGSSTDLIFNVAQIVESCSQDSTLFANSIILTGTRGCGHGDEPTSMAEAG
jgi:2-keto-4-pentenoate hydratase/2-oxohepta-3-ene-1,7-dioic acid hydratase in catechol pathway